jgi:hypothetical protein
MHFKINGKVLYIDISDAPKEEILLVINTVISVCEYLEESAQKSIKIKIKKDPKIVHVNS